MNLLPQPVKDELLSTLTLLTIISHQIIFVKIILKRPDYIGYFYFDFSYIYNILLRFNFRGPLAHLVERFHGMEEATGSIPVRSTKL